MESSDEKRTGILKAHVAINVRDVDSSVQFYRKLFGIEPSKHRPKYAKFDVERPPLNLTLNERPFTDSGALFHMGIQVSSTEDVLAMRDRWVDAGLSTRDEMQIVCGYALQDKSWVTDPDGNQWEVFVVHKDNLPTYYEEAAKSPCNSQQPDACSASVLAAGTSYSSALPTTVETVEDLRELS